MLKGTFGAALEQFWAVRGRSKTAFAKEILWGKEHSELLWNSPSKFMGGPMCFQQRKFSGKKNIRSCAETVLGSSWAVQDCCRNRNSTGKKSELF